MTNNKFKKASEYKQMQIALITATRNLMTVYCCLHKLGITKRKVIALDDELLKEYVPECKRDAAADVLLPKAKRFLEQVGIEWKVICEIVIKISTPYLEEGKFSRDQLLHLMQSMAEDMAMYMRLLHNELGYGKIRLMRVLNAVNLYKGDALSEAAERFDFDYGDMSVLPTVKTGKEPIVDKETAEQLRMLLAGR